MAGSPTVAAPDHHRQNAAATDSSRWKIGFARFVPYPSASSTLPRLVPLSTKLRLSSPHGTWLSSSSSAVSLRIFPDESNSDAILSVELADKVLEEHYVSKLNFSWPQLTCVSGFPPRGSRAIFVTYRDSTDEIQKFALRFSTFDAAKTFVATLKEKLKGVGEAGTQKSENKSEISFQSDHMSSKKILRRASKVDADIAIPLDCYAPEMPPRLEYEVEQPSSSQQEATLGHVPNKTSSVLPPSFTTLLSSCFSQADQDAGLTNVKEEADLKQQIMRYMEDSSFQEMLLKVEKVIDEIGGNWIL